MDVRRGLVRRGGAGGGVRRAAEGELMAAGRSHRSTARRRRRRRRSAPSASRTSCAPACRTASRCCAARLPGLPLVSLELIAPAGAQYDPAEQRGDRHPHRRRCSTRGRPGGPRWRSRPTSSGWAAISPPAPTGTWAISRPGCCRATAGRGSSCWPRCRRSDLPRARDRAAAPAAARRDPAPAPGPRRRSPTTASSARSSAAPSTPSRSTAPRRASRGSTATTLLGFYRGHYGFAGSTLIAVGDLDPEEILREAESRLRRRRPARAGAGAAGDPARLPPADRGPRRRPPGRRPDRAPAGARGGAAHRIPTTSPCWCSTRCWAASSPAGSTSTCASGTATPTAPPAASARGGARARSSSPRRWRPRRPAPPPARCSTSCGGSARPWSSRTELAETAGYIVGVFPYSLQTVGDVARRLETLAVFGLPDDYYDALSGADRGGHPRGDPGGGAPPSRSRADRRGGGGSGRGPGAAARGDGAGDRLVAGGGAPRRPAAPGPLSWIN